MRLERRELLVGVIGVNVTLGAGCSGKDDGIDDVTLYNETGESHRGTLVMKRIADGETILEDEFSIEASSGSSVSFGEPVEKAGRLEVCVTLESGRADQSEWDVPSSGNSKLQNETYGLQIVLLEQSIEFKQVSSGAD